MDAICICPDCRRLAAGIARSAAELEAATEVLAESMARNMIREGIDLAELERQWRSASPETPDDRSTRLLLTAAERHRLRLLASNDVHQAE